MVKYVALAVALYIVTGFLAFCGCATRPAKEASYHFYVLDLQAKSLNGPTPEDDQSLESCWSGYDEKYKCIVMFTDDFYKMKSEFDELKLRDNVCQKYMGSGDN